MHISWTLFLGWLVLVVLTLVGVCGMFVLFGRVLEMLTTVPAFGFEEEYELTDIPPRANPKGPFKFPCPTWKGGCYCSPEFSCQEPYVSVTVVDKDGDFVSLAEVRREYMEHEIAMGEQLEEVALGHA